jgi:hypothetical protein
MAEYDTDEKMGGRDHDVLREGTRRVCPHCGKPIEVMAGELKKGGDRGEFDRAIRRMG